MLTRLRLANFKSWADTGNVELRPITGFFGPNSSGKSSLLQALLLLKQTSDASKKTPVFLFGDSDTPADLNSFDSVIHGHDSKRALGISLDWKVDWPVTILDRQKGTIATSETVSFSVRVSQRKGSKKPATVEQMLYRVGASQFGLHRRKAGYDLVAEGGDFRFSRTFERSRSLPAPPHFYGFPTQVQTWYENAGFLTTLEHEFLGCLNALHYVGPLRSYPERIYSPFTRIEKGSRETLANILSEFLDRGEQIYDEEANALRSIEEHVGLWLRRLGLIANFVVEDKGYSSYRILVQKTSTSVQVPITDVGFGVSQILPIILLCFAAPEGSTIILEQPEIHLHPAVQSGLADVIIDAYRSRRIQVIVESHSEHLLRRLQRRVADETLRPTEVGLWFCESNGHNSTIRELELDPFGTIGNWPKDFFGDQFGEVASMAKDRLRRKASA